MKTFALFLLFATVSASRRTTFSNGPYDHPPMTVAGPWGMPTEKPKKAEPMKKEVKPVKRVVKPKKCKKDDEDFPLGCHTISELEAACCGLE
mmetsp:Transcript_16440/g.40106  ORF Transcript_16440/g.40106 Transcript_16440/m.40106 type:complete len:92 (-) Transcript_16440:482-757(-)|eukprot:CAMPEP_0113467628 /NCGR_PEP_ID=MMETSP0014_2-20120614/14916_1 /TAXON_ID=2857 /ORGANISM="Nitzschia sp." /LENGTH=91 /DNA_ID=CAMNT_0000359949 /DNA_START=233 /DNA_END=508 /DNA_ORIENTATION=+ /assembly_acc=CAM_ASM_000159